MSKSVVVDLKQSGVSKFDSYLPSYGSPPGIQVHQVALQCHRCLPKEVRSIFCENIRESKASLPSGKNVERKLLPAVPFIVIISGKEASISFPMLDRNVDYPSFFGTDSTFLRWVIDLHLYYWEQAKTWYSP